MKRLWATLPLLVVCGCADGTATPDAASQSQRIVAVRTAAPELRTVEYVTEALGTVESRATPIVASEVAGTVETIHVEEGDAVEAGERLLKIDDTLFRVEQAAAQAKLQHQQALLALHNRQVRRLENLSRSNASTEQQLDEAGAQVEVTQAQISVTEQQLAHARLRLEKTEVETPMTGVIARRHVSPGDYVGIGTPLFDLADMNRLRARFALPEYETQSIQPGTTVSMTSPVGSESPVTASVQFINPKVSSTNRSVQAIVDFENPGGWQPGASVNARFIKQRVVEAITVPSRAVVERANGKVVYLIDNRDRAAERTVTTGWSENGWTHIIDGLSPSDAVVVEGAQYLTDGTPVSVEERTP